MRCEELRPRRDDVHELIQYDESEAFAVWLGQQGGSYRIEDLLNRYLLEAAGTGGATDIVSTILRHPRFSPSAQTVVALERAGHLGAANGIDLPRTPLVVSALEEVRRRWPDEKALPRTRVNWMNFP